MTKFIGTTVEDSIEEKIMEIARRERKYKAQVIRELVENAVEDENEQTDE